MKRSSRAPSRPASWQGPLFLLLAAFVWGTTFVAQRLVSDTVGHFTFNGIRMLLGSAFLLPVIAVKNKGKLFATLHSRESRRALAVGGILCGVLVFTAASFQQAGIQAGTSAGKSGFITAVYVIFVPLVGLFFRRRVPVLTWPSVVVAAVGLYCLCVADFSRGWAGVLQDFTFSKGDLLTLVCAFVFTFHILTVDRFAPETDGVWLSCVQFFLGGVIGCVLMLVFERPAWSQIVSASGGILYSAVVSCVIGYTLQILGQQKTPPALAALIMCLESVFAVLSDVVFLRTKMTAEQITGCVLLFIALTVCASADRILPAKAKKKSKRKK